MVRGTEVMENRGREGGFVARGMFTLLVSV